MPIEQVIAAHLDLLFPGMKIESFHVFRVTRDADIEIEVDEADDLLSALRTELLRRRRVARGRPARDRPDDAEGAARAAAARAAT